MLTLRLDDCATSVPPTTRNTAV